MEASAKEHIDSSPADASALEGSIDTLDRGERSSLAARQIADARATKAEAIRKACGSRDVEALAMHATSEGGLLEDELRQIACESITILKAGWALMISITGPVLLRCDEELRQTDTIPGIKCSRHADEDQVELDVNRSFVYYPKGMLLPMSGAYGLRCSEC